MSWGVPRYTRWRWVGERPAAVGLVESSQRGFDLHDPKNPWCFRRRAISHRAAIKQAVDELRVESAPRYQPGGSTFCNVYVVDFCRAIGAPLPRWDPICGGELSAEDLRRWLAGDGRSLGWRPITAGGGAFRGERNVGHRVACA